MSYGNSCLPIRRSSISSRIPASLTPKAQAAHTIALGQAKELIVAMDCVETDELAPLGEIVLTQDLADRTPTLLTKLTESVSRRP